MNDGSRVCDPGDFLEAATRRAVERLASLDAASGGLERLAAIRALVTSLDADDASLTAVRDALDAGGGWDAIADAAQVQVPAARNRWQGSDDEIAARRESSRRRGRRPSARPRDLPGLSVAEAARRLGVTPQAVYNRVSRGLLEARTVELEDGRRYKRVFPSE